LVQRLSQQCTKVSAESAQPTNALDNNVHTSNIEDSEHGLQSSRRIPKLPAQPLAHTAWEIRREEVAVMEAVATEVEALGADLRTRWTVWCG
jgi:hypothetical protein